MEKYILKLLKTMKWECVAVWILCVVVLALGELNVIPNNITEPKSQSEYMWNMSVVVGTLLAMPLALKLFTLNTTKGLRRLNYDDALKTYHIWSAVRLGIIAIVALLGFAVYYLASSVPSFCCGLIAVGVTLYCWPSFDKIEAYIEEVKK